MPLNFDCSRVWQRTENSTTVAAFGSESVNGEQEKESNVRMGSKISSIVTTVCHHLASLVMPNGDLWDGFSYPTLLDSICL